MILSYDYPLLGVFWSMFIFFLWFVWLMLLFRIFGDIFRSDDLGGFAKAMWIIFVIFLPFLGVFIYLIARGHSMAERQMEQIQAQQASFDAHVREAAGAGNTADQIEKLAQLKAQGALTDEEFAAQKAKLLG